MREGWENWAAIVGQGRALTPVLSVWLLDGRVLKWLRGSDFLPFSFFFPCLFASFFSSGFEPRLLSMLGTLE